MLSIHFGAWQTVCGWSRELARRFLFQTIRDAALLVDRARAGRGASPSAAVIDSQLVKAPQAGTRGYDAAKKDRRAQASHRRRYRRAAVDGQPDDERHFRQRQRPDDP